jgi:hypothetical protein
VAIKETEHKHTMVISAELSLVLSSNWLFKDKINQVNRDCQSGTERKDFWGSAAMNELNLYHLGGLLPWSHFEQRVGVDLDEVKDGLPGVIV